MRRVSSMDDHTKEAFEVILLHFDPDEFELMAILHLLGKGLLPCNEQFIEFVVLNLIE